MSKRQEIRERRRKEKQRNKMIMIGVMIIGAGLIAAAMIYPSTQASTEFHTRYMADGNAMGNPDAPVTIVEYADYKCSHCATFALETEPLLVEAFIETDKVYFVSRSVGDMLGSAPSVLATEASYCAGDQNKYWEIHDLVFANQGATFTEGLLENWAKTAGVEMDAFKECMDSNIYTDRIAQDKVDAQAEGISGTPSFVITYMVDGEEVKQFLPGNYPFESFAQTIEQAYREMGLE